MASSTWFVPVHVAVAVKVHVNVNVDVKAPIGNQGVLDSFSFEESDDPEDVIVRCCTRSLVHRS